MIFRRQESFRYTFNKPIDCLYKIIKIDDSSLDSDFGRGQIIDISPNGLKMVSTLNLSPGLKKIEIEIHFSIENRTFQIPGVIQWQKKEFLKSGYSYGVKLESSEEITRSIINGLKKHAEKSMKEKNSNNSHTQSLQKMLKYTQEFANLKTPR